MLGILLITTPMKACTPDFGNEIANENAKYIMWIFDDILLEQLADYNKAGMLTSSEVTQEGIVYFFEYVESPSCDNIVETLEVMKIPENVISISAVLNLNNKVKGVKITVNEDLLTYFHNRNSLRERA